MAEATSQDPSVVEPGAMMSQFFRTITSGGSPMSPNSDLAMQLAVELSLGDLRKIEGNTTHDNVSYQGTYEVAKDLDFSFTSGYAYAWQISLNGVETDIERAKPFDVSQPEPTLPEQAFNWLLSALAVILCIFVLYGNTRMQHWGWTFMALAFTVVAFILTPNVRTGTHVLGGHWHAVAFVNLSLVTACLFSSLGYELAPVATRRFVGEPFGVRRQQYYEEYTRRRFLQLCAFDLRERHPAAQPLKVQLKAIIQPFNVLTAFYFPTILHTGFLFGLAGYVYILIQFIVTIRSLTQSLKSLNNKVVASLLQLLARMDDAYSIVAGSELPDDALKSSMTQLNLIQGWFSDLIRSINMGFTIGVVLAAIVTLGALAFTYIDFRRKVMLLRLGKYTFRKKDAPIVRQATFVGDMVVCAMVGFVMIVLVCLLVTVPLSWSLSWNIIWSFRHWIITTAVTFIVNKVIMLVAKKLLFKPVAFINRPLCSIFLFWQIWVSLVAGLMGAAMRVGMALLGVILTLPQLPCPVTPDSFNKIVLLDSSHVAYLSLVHTYHLHNNPIMVVAADKLLQLLELRKKRLSAGANELDDLCRSRLHTKHRLLLILIRWPALKYQRKAYLEQQRQMKKKPVELNEASKAKQPHPPEVVVAFAEPEEKTEAKPKSPILANIFHCFRSAPVAPLD